MKCHENNAALDLDMTQPSGTISTLILIISAIGLALWIAMTFWVYRDLHSRSRDGIVQLLGTLVVALANLPGLVLYLILRPQETLAQQYERALEEEALLQSIEERAICPGCNQAIKDDWRVCPHCYTRLKKACENCGQLMELPWTICPFCEHSQTALVTGRRVVTNQSFVQSQPVSPDLPPLQSEQISTLED